MKTTKRGGLYQLTLFPGWFPVNCYLVEEDDSLTLVDAALPVAARGILQAAATIGKPIARIVLTHAHEDHVGALDGLKRALPDVPVYCSVRDAKLFDGDLGLQPGEPNAPIKGGVPKKLTARPDRPLHEGDRIGSLRAVAAPGHTPGSMAFFDERDGALIAGDAFQTRGRVAVSGTLVPWFPFPALATWHASTALASARKLAALRPTLLVVGHGSLLPAPSEAIDRAIREASARLARKEGA
ncbi:MBL fold metallo-hydrolase [Paenibacillus sp.]|uniref:MBL fold metallo-hydrolase n=1 Tax=Paenibacillus sp. TaxID=58172 RepID=UPI002D75B809|nr:MBL fold metallo-hydrolase [Paenibacillus sp.]HZG55239.1 MBL fold metallo-hydrolase [Paenibacillus sp.]